MDPALLEEVFREKPALHRFPRRWRRRTQELCELVVDEYGGDASRVWEEATDGADLERRLNGLPGFGDMKVRILAAVLGKRLGIRPAGWERSPRPLLSRRRRLAGDARRVPEREACPQGRAARRRDRRRRPRSRRACRRTPRAGHGRRPVRSEAQLGIGRAHVRATVNGHTFRTGRPLRRRRLPGLHRQARESTAISDGELSRSSSSSTRSRVRRRPGRARRRAGGRRRAQARSPRSRRRREYAS